MESFSQLDERLVSIVEGMDQLINSFDELQVEEIIPSSVENFEDSTIVILDKLLFELLEIESIRENFITETESEEIQDLDDKFNFGLCISNIGPKIDFIDFDQADPSPTNMRLGIFAQLYNDGFNKVNFLFDANKLLVTRYQMMDWDGDGFVGGYDEFGNWVSESDPLAVYNKDGKKEYDSKGYIDDPWYLAIATAWLDDWYFGGDIDHDGNRKIGGYSCSGGELIEKTLEEFVCKDGEWIETDYVEFNDSEYGVYGKPFGPNKDKAKKEKGTGDNRSFTKELEEMVYNVGMEYWYTDAFALRAGYIYDFEGKIFNPTFGAGIRLLQYGFDFGYTAGEQGHPRANTMFFSVNIKL
ncbi:PorV/PorQ family protein [Marine Group I thaumarchaeote]|uniref:PorV/PorQ family protein n=1 Tax=Marine Group I thaumarchaeote TaxID=2511932 RepID=A0A7K4MS19_9ARCH|nr:PorV/PorQ family protein [Marine Group I thaumarchaeote]